MYSVSAMAANQANLSQSIGMAQAAQMGLGQTEAQALGISNLTDSINATGPAYKLSIGEQAVDFPTYSADGSTGGGAEIVTKTLDTSNQYANRAENAYAMQNSYQFNKEILGSFL